MLGKPNFETPVQDPDNPVGKFAPFWQRWLSSLRSAVVDLQNSASPDISTLQALQSGIRPPLVTPADLGELRTLLFLRTPATGLGSSGGRIIYDTHANRASYPAGAYPNSWYAESDRGVVYASLNGAWVYAFGTMEGTFAQIPADLTDNDKGFLYAVTTGTGGVAYNHVIQWVSAAAKWKVADGYSFGNYFQDFAGVPQEPGWQLVDGTTTKYLTIVAGVVTENAITLPDWKNNPVYRKSGAAYAGAPVAAATPTATNPAIANAATGVTIPANTGNDSGGGTAVQSGAGTTVATHTHTHTEGPVNDPTHTHTIGNPTISLAPGDPIPNATVLVYYRQ